jgi:hypothetical protein
MHGIVKLRNLVQDNPDEGWRSRYGGHGTEEVVAPAGEHSIGVAGSGRMGTSA